MSWRCCWSDIFQGELNIKVFSLLCQYFVIYLILDKRLHSKVQQFVLILHFHFPKLRWVSRVAFACEINLLFNGAESDVRLFPLQFWLILYSIVFLLPMPKEILATCFLRTYAMKIHLVFATRGLTLQLANVG